VGGARFSAPVQTGPGAYSASYTMGTGTFPGVKRPGRGVNHPPQSGTEVKDRVEFTSIPHLCLQGRLLGEFYLYQTSSVLECLGRDWNQVPLEYIVLQLGFLKMSERRTVCRSVSWARRKWLRRTAEVIRFYLLHYDINIFCVSYL